MLFGPFSNFFWPYLRVELTIWPQIGRIEEGLRFCVRPKKKFSKKKISTVLRPLRHRKKADFLRWFFDQKYSFGRLLKEKFKIKPCTKRKSCRADPQLSNASNQSPLAPLETAESPPQKNGPRIRCWWVWWWGWGDYGAQNGPKSTFDPENIKKWVM